MSNTEPGSGIALDKTPVHLAASGTAYAIDGFTFGPSGFEAYIAANTSPSDPGRLVFVERSVESWGMWECHRAGDELVIVITGVAIFIQEIDGIEVRGGLPHSVPRHRAPAAVGRRRSRGVQPSPTVSGGAPTPPRCRRGGRFLRSPLGCGCRGGRRERARLQRSTGP